MTCFLIISYTNHLQSDDEKLALLGAKPVMRRERLVSAEASLPVLDRALPASVIIATQFLKKFKLKIRLILFLFACPDID